MKCMSMLLSYITIQLINVCRLTKCWLIGLSGKQEYFKGQAIWVKAGKLSTNRILTEYILKSMWPFQNDSEELIFWIFKMLSMTEESKTEIDFLLLDDVNVLRNIILIFFYEKPKNK